MNFAEYECALASGELGVVASGYQDVWVVHSGHRPTGMWRRELGGHYRRQAASVEAYDALTRVYCQHALPLLPIPFGSVVNRC
jgi:hypothetical protein